MQMHATSVQRVIAAVFVRPDDGVMVGMSKTRASGRCRLHSWSCEGKLLTHLPLLTSRTICYMQKGCDILVLGR